MWNCWKTATRDNNKILQRQLITICNVYLNHTGRHPAMESLLRRPQMRRTWMIATTSRVPTSCPISSASTSVGRRLLAWVVFAVVCRSCTVTTQGRLIPVVVVCSGLNVTLPTVTTWRILIPVVFLMMKLFCLFSKKKNSTKI